MHFASNYSTNGRLHLLLIRRHIILVDKFCVGAQQSCRPRFRSFVFDERCIFVQYDLPNTKKKKKKICTYENRINFITKWGQPMESTEIGGEAKVYESLWSGGNESGSSGFYFPVYTLCMSFTFKEQMMEFVIALSRTV